MFFVYSQISQLCLVVYLYLGIKILKKCTPSKVTRLAFAICLSVGYWAFCNIFYYTRFSPYSTFSEAFYDFWWYAQLPGAYSYGPIMMHMALIKSKPELMKQNKWLDYVIYLPSLILVILNIIVYAGFWDAGFNLSPLLQVIYFVPYNTISLLLLYSWKKNAKLKRERIQAAHILKYGIISLSCALVYQGYFIAIAGVYAPAFSDVILLLVVASVWHVTLKYNFIDIKDLVSSEDIIENVNDFIILVNWDNKIVKVNKSLLQNLGHSKKNLIGKPFDIILKPESSDSHPEENLALYVSGNDRSYNCELITADNELIPVYASVNTVKDSTGERMGTLFICKDMRAVMELQAEVAYRMQKEMQLNYLSMHDALTGLYNRTFFENEIQRLDSDNLDSVGIIVCDLDGLKFVNDTLGHAKGDELLISTARLLNESVSENAVVARIGGDEFAIIITKCDTELLEKTESQIRDAIGRYNSNNQVIPLSISIGSAISSDSGISMYSLYKKADTAMYREKLIHRRSVRNTTIQALSNMMHARDFITQEHINRMKNLADKFGRRLGLSTEQLNTLSLFVQFHDIGKVGIPDSILFKTSPLTPEEMDEMKRHTEIGYKIASSTPDISQIADLILMHHERWDGKGYTLGLKGEEIPLECRIMCIIDAFDAMTNDRPYRKAMTIDEALKEIASNSGTQFDPHLANSFLEMIRDERKKEKALSV